jgi:hypothetical protein
MRWTLWLWEQGAGQLIVESDNRAFAEDQLIAVLGAAGAGQSVRLYDGSQCRAELGRRRAER